MNTDIGLDKLYGYKAASSKIKEDVKKEEKNSKRNLYLIWVAHKTETYKKSHCKKLTNVDSTK